MHIKWDVNLLQLASVCTCAGTQCYTPALAPAFARLWQCPTAAIVTTKKEKQNKKKPTNWIMSH